MCGSMSQAADPTVRPNWLGLRGLSVLVLVFGFMQMPAGLSHGRVIQHGEPNAKMAASRAFSGHNITWHKEDFPWVVYFYRDPDPKFMAPLDGYLTGFGLELNKDLLLINRAVVARSTVRFDNKTNTYSVLAARRVKYQPLVDPSESIWIVDHEPESSVSSNPEFDWSRTNATMLVIQLVGNMTDTWSIYRVVLVGYDRREHWWEDNDKTEYCEIKLLPGHTVGRPALCGTKYDRYPSLDSEKSSDDTIFASSLGYCYAYTLSAVDWKEANKYALSFGLPEYPKHLVNMDPKKSMDVTRYWSRWPVKRTKCWEKNGTICEFEYDESRWQEDYREGRYNPPRAYKCGTFSDVGAPIMCGRYMPIAVQADYSYRGKYYEREYLRLAFVLEAPDNVDPTKPIVKDSGCNGTFTARRIFPHYSQLKALLSLS